MAVNFEEGTLDGKFVFVIDANDAKEANNFLDSNGLTVGITTRNVTLIYPPTDADDDKKQKIRDALSEDM